MALPQHFPIGYRIPAAPATAAPRAAGSAANRRWRTEWEIRKLLPLRPQGTASQGAAEAGRASATGQLAKAIAASAWAATKRSHQRARMTAASSRYRSRRWRRSWGSRAGLHLVATPSHQQVVRAVAV